MDDSGARRLTISLVEEYLKGSLSTEEFIDRYWSTRNKLLDSNWGAFEGGFGEVMSAMDSAAHVYSADVDRADWEIDDSRLRTEAASVVAKARAAGLLDQ